ncbi:MAG: hypothetical protein PHC68_17475 [Syntrophorhabdaceae bacterium]|nr:hypothetical protein [Syntrophorhabdaceae bacterium]
MAGFKFGGQAVGWLRSYRLTDDMIANIERAVDLDRQIAAATRPPPSASTLYRRRAREYERLAKRLGKG